MSTKNNSNFHTLYLCYFWLNEPLVQTQVLPYLRELQKDGIKVSLMTFEREMNKNWTREQIEEQRAKFAAERIDWYALPYHKSPSVPATFYDVYNGARLARKIIREKKVDILHARVHVPAMMSAIARKFSRQKPKLIFDIRGFFPEEYTDAGRWKKNGLLYNSVKRVEKWLLKEADAFVVLTEAARQVLFPESKETGFDKFGRPVEVIPCCVDFENRFQNNYQALRKKARNELKLNNRLVITHLGALGGLYLTENIVDFLRVARNIYPNTFAMFLTQTNPDSVISLLKEKGFKEDDFFVDKIEPNEVQHYLSASDIALSFVKAGYATVSRSPTKIPEYLACGLPIVSNKGIGDVDELITREKVGVFIDDFNTKSYINALEKVLALKNEGNFVERCQLCAENRFNLEKVGGKRYRNLYKKLLIEKELS